MNIAVTTERGAFYNQNLDIGADTASAEYCAEKIEQRCQLITKGRLNRINSISTDTCDTMLKTARLLQATPSMKHTFMIPCDPHGLQLLIQDICEFPAFAPTVKQADEIVAHFKQSKKQYQILKQLQRQCYDGKALALIMSCDVRWGTYSGEFQRLLSEAKALRVFSTEPRVQAELHASARAQRVAKSLASHLFWLQLAQLEEIITPIHEAQIEAQSDHAHIGYVRGRWDKIWTHLKQCEKRTPSYNWPVLWTTLEARKKRQLTDLHTLAHWLMPSNVLNGRFAPGKTSLF